MGIFSRLSDIINSNLNAILDRAEDPEKIIRLVIQEMEDTLVEVRSSAVKTVAEKKEIERRLVELRREAEEWQRKAELALSKDREDLAKGALMARAKIAEAADGLTTDLGRLDEALAKTNDDIGQLQAKLQDAKTRERAIVARQKTATARLKVKTQLHDDRITDAFSRFDQIERNLDVLEGKAEVLDMGRKRSLADEIAELENNDKVESELQALKAKLATKNQG
ncbi:MULTISPECIES: phage shock protein PspA [Nitrospirillum]|uniref:Phage shock protein A (PspA) family protein n=1 Tax=Nitrospirillum amazonense TaxID=28077 RepID=A0A560JVL4_9PROT|nr:phage shock protein PspA [Nitrospirillum amazonense]EGY01522.1 phage shock protein A [Nitrospirillum amazonense Y2]MDG3440490.1 phage shock protein PspA [Nitrospirillum amazonense]TWB49591.1 phage shock protein A (PspA) family protein [Nitrospirillum amazonense]TWB75173.1 phage shock protein A (PspA) family protein [Nitrospirillum amazonense]